MNLTLSLTHACNLACSYCYAGPASRRSMSWEVAQRAIDLAFEQQPSTLTLGFFGGEPLLEWELLQRATLYAGERAQERGIPIRRTVTTNGTRFTDARLEWLAELDFDTGISIDGGREMHDTTRPLRGGGSSFDSCRRGLEAALAVLPRLEVITVVDPENVRHLPVGIQSLIDAGVTDISLNPNFNATWDTDGRDAWAEAYEAVGELLVDRYRSGRPVAIDFIDSKIITHLKGGFDCADKCSFGEREIAVAPSGRMYPCERLIGTDQGGELCLGDVVSGFDETARQRLIGGRGNGDQACEGCAVRQRCMNWCGCINYVTTGAIDRSAGILCFHERLAVGVADGVAATLFAEGNAHFFERFYYEDGLA